MRVPSLAPPFFQTKMSSSSKSTSNANYDTRQELADLVKRRAEITVSCRVITEDCHGTREERLTDILLLPRTRCVSWSDRFMHLKEVTWKIHNCMVTSSEVGIDI